MAEVNDGGPAFPVENIIAEGQIVCHRGMSLRDYFAAKAMQGMLTSVAGTVRVGNAEEATAYAKGHCNAVVVERAYVIADAMLRAREVAAR